MLKNMSETNENKENLKFKIAPLYTTKITKFPLHENPIFGMQKALKIKPFDLTEYTLEERIDLINDKKVTGIAYETISGNVNALSYELINDHFIKLKNNKTEERRNIFNLLLDNFNDAEETNKKNENAPEIKKKLTVSAP